MCKNLINLIKKEINEYEIDVRNLNKKLSEYRPVYEALKPKGKRFKKENALRLTESKELLNKLIEIVQKTNLVSIEQMIQSKISFEKHDKEVKQILKEYGLSKEEIFNDKFLSVLKERSKTNEKIKLVYEKLIEMKKRDEQLFKLNEKIVLYICESMIDLYEGLLNEKETVKNNKKDLEYALKNIVSKNALTARNIICISLFLSKFEDEKAELLKELDDYLNKIKSASPSISPKNEPSTQLNKPKIYVDEGKNVIQNEPLEEGLDQEDENQINYLANNYLMALNFFDNYKDVDLFLDSVKYDFDIGKILLKVVDLLGDSDNEEKLKKHLLEYLNNLKSEPINENNEEENVLLYFGFMEKKNKIYADILKGDVPSEYYDDVLKGLEMIKNNDLKAHVGSITSVRKVFKVRVNDIRITYKKIAGNVFVILGVFCKKDNKGNHIIAKTKDRAEILSHLENSILKAIEIPDLWEEFLKINAEYEENIINLLKVKRK